MLARAVATSPVVRVVSMSPRAVTTSSIFALRFVSASPTAVFTSSTAVLTRPRAVTAFVRPVVTAVEIASSFVDSVVVWLVIACSRAASFSAVVLPEVSIAVLISSSAVASSLAPLAMAASMAASFVDSVDVWLLMACSIFASFSASVPCSDSTAFWISSRCSFASAMPVSTAVSIASSFVSRLLVWLSIASCRAASFSSTVPCSDSMASFSRPSCSFWSAKPSLTAVSTKASLAPRSVVWSFTAVSMAANFSSIVPPTVSIASLIRSCAVFTSARPVVTAASTRPSFVSKLVVWSLIAVSTAASFSSTVPFSDSRASFSRSCCVLASAKPAFTAASTRPSFISRLVVWFLIAVSMAASFSAIVPLIDSTACWMSFIAA